MKLPLSPSLGTAAPLDLPEVPVQGTSEPLADFESRIRTWSAQAQALTGYMRLVVQNVTSAAERYYMQQAAVPPTERDMTWCATIAILQGSGDPTKAVAQAQSVRANFLSATKPSIPFPIKK